MKVNAYRNASNTESYTVIKNGVEFDLSAAGVTKIEVVAGTAEISSITDDVVFSGSTLSIKWGSLNLDKGGVKPTIYAYKVDDLEGEVLFGPNKSEILLEVIPDSRSV
ncbi:MAG TPA: hypothetical protein VIC51_16210 [Psychromonas sp.]